MFTIFGCIFVTRVWALACRVWLGGLAWCWLTWSISWSLIFWRLGLWGASLEIYSWRLDICLLRTTFQHLSFGGLHFDICLVEDLVYVWRLISWGFGYTLRFDIWLGYLNHVALGLSCFGWTFGAWVRGASLGLTFGGLDYVELILELSCGDSFWRLGVGIVEACSCFILFMQDWVLLSLRVGLLKLLLIGFKRKQVGTCT